MKLNERCAQGDADGSCLIQQAGVPSPHSPTPGGTGQRITLPPAASSITPLSQFGEMSVFSLISTRMTTFPKFNSHNAKKAFSFIRPKMMAAQYEKVPQSYFGVFGILLRSSSSLQSSCPLQPLSFQI